MLIKVCGMREADNIRAVEAAGADWMGFIFFPRSPRCVTDVPEYLPQHCRRVGVFVNADMEEILQKAREWHLDFIQLHGDETPEQCRALKAQGLGVIRAFRVATPQDLTATAHYADGCDYFLFDTPTKDFGGSGRQFDWQLLRHYTGTTPFLLSGGLGPDSIAALRDFRHPACCGIDLNSRFETAPAQKDAAALASFIQEIRHFNA